MTIQELAALVLSDLAAIRGGSRVAEFDSEQDRRESSAIVKRIREALAPVEEDNKVILEALEDYAVDLELRLELRSDPAIIQGLDKRASDRRAVTDRFRLRGLAEAEMRRALKNVRMIAARMRRSSEGKQAEDIDHILRFCREGGVEGSILRDEAATRALRRKP